MSEPKRNKNDKEGFTRVSMLLPTPLKDKARAIGGERGMTRVVINALTYYLNTNPVAVGEGVELEKDYERNRYFAQELMDLIAISETHEEIMDGFSEIEVPLWITTDGWSNRVSSRVKWAPEAPKKAKDWIEDPDITPEDKVARFEALGPETLGPDPEVEDGVEIPEPVVTPKSEVFKAAAAGSSDLLERIKAKAAEKGVDVDAANLVPASQIAQPAPVAVEPEPTPEPQWEPEEKAEQPEPKPEPEPKADSQDQLRACSECGDDLVDGECWTCELG